MYRLTTTSVIGDLVCVQVDNSDGKGEFLLEPTFESTEIAVLETKPESNYDTVK